MGAVSRPLRAGAEGHDAGAPRAGERPAPAVGTRVPSTPSS